MSVSGVLIKTKEPTRLRVRQTESLFVKSGESREGNRGRGDRNGIESEKN